MSASGDATQQEFLWRSHHERVGKLEMIPTSDGRKTENKANSRPHCADILWSHVWKLLIALESHVWLVNDGHCSQWSWYQVKMLPVKQTFPINGILVSK